MKKLVYIIVGLSIYAVAIAAPLFLILNTQDDYNIMEDVDEVAVEVVVNEALSYNQLEADADQIAVSGYEIIGIEYSEDKLFASIYLVTSCSVYEADGDSYVEVENSGLYLMLVESSVSIFGYEMTDVLVCEVEDDIDIQNNVPYALYGNLSSMDYYIDDIEEEKIGILDSLITGDFNSQPEANGESNTTEDFKGTDLVGNADIISSMIEDLKSRIDVELLYEVGSYNTTENISGEMVDVYYLTTQTIISETSSVVNFSKSYYIGTKIYMVSATYRINADDFVCIQIIE